MSCHGRVPETVVRPAAIARCALVALALACSAVDARAQSLAAKAKESGCVDAPRVVEGRTYRCNTASGAAAYFNVPGAADAPPPDTARRASGGVATPSPAGFPKVDTATQRGRDDMRRKVLGEELASEEKLLAEARVAYANGASRAIRSVTPSASRSSGRRSRCTSATSRRSARSWRPRAERATAPSRHARRLRARLLPAISGRAGEAAHPAPSCGVR